MREYKIGDICKWKNIDKFEYIVVHLITERNKLWGIWCFSEKKAIREFKEYKNTPDYNLPTLIRRDYQYITPTSRYFSFIRHYKEKITNWKKEMGE